MLTAGTHGEGEREYSELTTWYQLPVQVLLLTQQNPLHLLQVLIIRTRSNVYFTINSIGIPVVL